MVEPHAQPKNESQASRSTPKDNLSSQRKTIHTILIISLSILIITSLITTITLASTIKELARAAAEAREAARPGNVSLTIIGMDACPDCLDYTTLINQLSPVISVQEEANLTRTTAQSLIQQYEINSLPAIILAGEVGKANVQNLLEQLGARFINNTTAIIEDLQPPYYSLRDTRIRGIVDLTIYPCPAEGCTQLDTLPQALEQLGVRIGRVTVRHEVNTTLPIQTLPAAFISDELSVYQLDLGNAFKPAPNGYVYEPRLPPYYNLSSGTMEGNVTLIILTLPDCQDCYNVSVHEQILTRNRVYLGSIKRIPATSPEGERLRAQYQIISLPTILLSPAFSVYPLAQAWPSIGTREEDGWYVFRSTSFMQQLGGYQNLTLPES